MFGRRVGAVVLAVFALGLVTGCGEEGDGEDTGGEETVDAAELESEIQADLTESAGVEPEAVQCPDAIPLAEGEVFDCTVIAPNGDEVIFQGMLTDDQGSFEGEVPPEQFEDGGSGSGVPDIGTLEATLMTTIEDVRDSPETPLESVECPDDVDLADDPVTFDCELAGGSETGSVEVTVRGSQFEYTGAFGGSSFGGSPQEIDPAG